MTDHVKGKTIVVTGAAGGFGRLICRKAAARGANVVCGDVNEEGLAETVKLVTSAGGKASGKRTDVTDLAAMTALVAHAVETHGAVDVMINNAGIMPLAFFADHKAASAAWSKCIDINIKGVMNGIIAAYDPMMAQGRGHVINISSIYGNFPVVGAAVYGATKSAVNFLSESLRVEAAGKIKVTIIKPTGVPATGLGGAIVNPEAVVGILGQNTTAYIGAMTAILEGQVQDDRVNPDSTAYAVLDPAYIADAVITAIDQPWGVSLGDITIRAAGDAYIL
ncbi:MAG: SDR family oxidoreductase [Parvibaculum sp.]|uniref:SDR family oxidoreductase n=1 Tax=Parvibaculum sp. TaxID=2024848 RepID=UPI00271D390D|nr:SDR family oxidoreductase [Parvibaculum sp.]MDO8839076.1 SDR family oxidoreductase [Parvibaculum sp.]